MAAAPVRWDCIQRIVDVLEAEPALGSVGIYPGFPGDRIQKRESIWIDAPTGSLTVPVLTPGRRMMDDSFRLPVHVRVAGHRRLGEAMDRMSEILAAMYDPIVTGTSSLEDLDGVVSAIPSELVGPTAGETPADGVVAFAVWTIDVHARIT